MTEKGKAKDKDAGSYKQPGSPIKSGTSVRDDRKGKIEDDRKGRIGDDRRREVDSSLRSE